MFAFASILLLVPFVVQASVLTLQSPRFVITSSNGTQLRSEPIALNKPVPPLLALGPSDTLKLTFQIVGKDNGKGVVPHQTFLRFYEKSYKEEGIQPLRVSKDGKVKFELNMSKPPHTLPPTSDDPLKVTLLIGSFLHSPLKVELFDLNIPASHPPPQHPDEDSFHPLPEIRHTFRSEPVFPSETVSSIFAKLVLAPWFVLLGLWFKIVPRIPLHLSSGVIPFALALGALEFLLFWYWVELKLGDVLLWGAILTIPTVFAGKRALANIGDRRVGRK